MIPLPIRCESELIAGMMTTVVQHDCNPNSELERKDKVMRFKTLRDIAPGEEITAHYAADYCAFFFILLFSHLPRQCS